MKQFKLYEHPDGRRAAVKQGWSWPAACFSFVWAFSKGMYAIAAALLAAGFVLALLSTEADELFASGDRSARGADYLSHLCGWILIVVLGINGNELRERHLRARGYQLRGVRRASSSEDALAAAEDLELEKGL